MFLQTAWRGPLAAAWAVTTRTLAGDPPCITNPTTPALSGTVQISRSEVFTFRDRPQVGQPDPAEVLGREAVEGRRVGPRRRWVSVGMELGSASESRVERAMPCVSNH